MHNRKTVRKDEKNAPLLHASLLPPYPQKSHAEYIVRIYFHILLISDYWRILKYSAKLALKTDRKARLFLFFFWLFFLRRVAQIAF